MSSAAEKAREWAEHAEDAIHTDSERAYECREQAIMWAQVAAAEQRLPQVIVLQLPDGADLTAEDADELVQRLDAALNRRSR